MIFKFIGGSKHNQEIDISTDQAHEFIEVASDIEMKDHFSIAYDEDLKQNIFSTEVYRKMVYIYRVNDGSIRLWEVYVINSKYKEIQNDIDIAVYKLINSILGKGR
jgi:hypothetical protein